MDTTFPSFPLKSKFSVLSLLKVSIIWIHLFHFLSADKIDDLDGHFLAILGKYSDKINMAERGRSGNSTVDFFGKPCNYSVYASTSYKAWAEIEETLDFEKGAKYFEEFVEKERPNQSDEWRQAVCDAFPHSLLECRKKDMICRCLATKFTAFETEEETTDGPFKNLTVCRVKYGEKCDQKIPALHCYREYECLARVCGANSFISSAKFLLLVVAGAIFVMNAFAGEL